ncbi:MAG TPA: hypothetical protein VNE38_11565 [Ktedonobacteraceae bacterium]|nr:hypothetical protein [Ktedonobacteraceae bacterium]
MLEVYPGLYVGNQNDYDYDVSRRTGWAVVHACKEPYHSQALGYPPGKSAPKGQYYYVVQLENRLILNMVDAPNPAFFNKIEMIDKALNFIGQMRIREMNTLIHCNQGESRGPSIALLYMAARLNALPTDSLEVAEQKFCLIYPNYFPKPGIRGHLSRYWQQYCADGKQ